LGLDFPVWVLQSDENSYKASPLHSLGKSKKPVDVGIELLLIGTLNYMDKDGESIKSIELKCPAIRVLYFERSAVLYYWNKDHYEVVQTGD
jgi:hypothetical protein